MDLEYFPSRTPDVGSRMSDIEFDHVDCESEDCLHTEGSLRRTDVMWADGFSIATGFTKVEYGGGLSLEAKAGLDQYDGALSHVTLRLFLIDPISGTRVPMDFVLPTSLAHHLGSDLIGHAWHHSSNIDDFWFPVAAEDPDAEGVKIVARFNEVADGD